MHRALLFGLVIVLSAFTARSARAAEDAPPTELRDPQTESPPVTVDQERTLKVCGDGRDNDGDSFIDCDDQDCEIFAICIEPQRQPIERQAPVREESQAPIPNPEPVEPADRVVQRPFSIGIVPGLTTDGGASGKVENNFSLNLIGYSDYLTGAELGTLGNIRMKSVSGFQGAGIFNFTRESTSGFQGAGIFNGTGEEFTGFQGAGIANWNGGPVSGFQGAGIVNANLNRATGFQGAGIGNMNLGDFSGFQGAGIANFNKGPVIGFQGAGIGNVNGTGFSRGLQAAGIANVARSFEGAQISGIANVAVDELYGLQVGLVNYGQKVHGVQIGLVNIASKEMSGAPIGLVNYAGDGMLAFSFWGSDNAMLNAGLKMGTDHVYSILGYGVHPLGDETVRRDSLIAGLGGHLEVEPLWVELDLITHFLHGDFDWSEYDVDLISKVRATVGWRVLDQMSVFLGPTLNLLVSDVRREVGLIPSLWSHDEAGDVNLNLTFGFTAGLQFEPGWGKLNSR